MEGLPASAGDVAIDFVRECLHRIVVYKLQHVKPRCLDITKRKAPHLQYTDKGGSHSTDISQGRYAQSSLPKNTVKLRTFNTTFPL